MAKLPTEQDIKNRLRDEMAGIYGGPQDMHAPGTEPEAPVPELRELGIPKPILDKLRKQIQTHIDMAYIVDEASGQYKSRTKVREEAGDYIKGVLAEYAPADENPRLISEIYRIARYGSSRSSFSKDTARDELLRLGVPAQKIKQAWDKATSVNQVFSLRISPPGVAEDK